MNVLFIGNSYTFYNNLPGMLESMCAPVRDRLTTKMVTAGGKSLDWHWENPATLEAVDAGGWDAVVIQDRSLHPIEEPDKMRDAALKFAGRIKSVGASPVLFMTWARKHIPEMHDEIARMYTAVAQEAGARVAPVGNAWRRVYENYPDLELYDPDQSHPSILGSYLAACVFYTVLFGKSPVGLPNAYAICKDVSAVVKAETAALLQAEAQASVQAQP